MPGRFSIGNVDASRHGGVFCSWHNRRHSRSKVMEMWPPYVRFCDPCGCRTIHCWCKTCRQPEYACECDDEDQNLEERSPVTKVMSGMTPEQIWENYFKGRKLGQR
jgi:hypothetical protein